MSIDEIRTLKNAEPFQPFTMTLRNGRKLSVDSKRVVSWSPSGKVLAVDVGSAFAFVDLPEVVTVERQSTPRENR